MLSYWGIVKATRKHHLVLVTAPNLKTARELAKSALEEHLAACANLVPQLESHFWWQGKLERCAEVLIIFKTTTDNLKKLEEVVIQNHPYDTAEFLVLPVSTGSKRYLKWVTDSVK